MMKQAMLNCKVLLCCTLFLVIQGCSSEAVTENTQFKRLSARHTGLHFSNRLTQSQAFNVFTYMYFFNGGGVAAGDFNLDGMEDLFFTSNMESNALFLNRGELTFQDVTEFAGVEGLPGWTSGATVVDINQDGLLDIYVSQIGAYKEIVGHNQLFVCQEVKDGIPIFEEKAAEYGLDLIGFGTQAAFFDYDLDGDLDMFQLNHSLHQNGTFGRRPEFKDEPHPTSGDKLMRNDNGKFVNVTLDAGIYSTVIGYGLGLAIGDINQDGWPDIYVGNDFHENDYLYLNQQDGTFQEVGTKALKHTSRFSMGVDLGDVNNDGFMDIMSLDMLPEDPFILKTSLGEDGYNIFQFKLGHGYHPQFARNHLQLNNQDGTFNDIGRFAGVEASDWSWAPLFFDFNHDGYRDLFVSNGIPRRMNDIDYINFKTDQNNVLDIKAINGAIDQHDLSIIEKMPQIKLKNKFYLNQGDLTFKSIETHIAADLPSYSNGACYIDLDNDGDLEIVVNNIDDEPFVYQNLSVEKSEADKHFLQLKLVGPEGNRNAIGAKVIVFKGAERIIQEHFPVRGYQSSMGIGMHLGIGELVNIDSMVLIWPDQTYELIPNTETDKRLTLAWKKGLPRFDFQTLQQSSREDFQLEDIAGPVGLDFAHQENPFVDFNRETLIPLMVSAEGPALAIGDVNGDQKDDVFFGGSKRQPGRLYIQTAENHFKAANTPAIQLDSICEDIDAAFVDIENDGDLDLVVLSGGNEYRLNSPFSQPRLYLNDGQDHFTKSPAFEGIRLTGGSLAVGDVNGDNLPDLFFGARATPWSYGEIPTSYLMINQGNGRFTDQALVFHEQLPQIGMVKDAKLVDLDQDQDLDLLLALEWGPITWMRNEGGRFEKIFIDQAKGWWNNLLVHDIDRDGDLDILAGNMGKNGRLRPTQDEPVKMLVGDFDQNNQVEQILTYYVKGQEIPFANHKELTTQLVSIKKKYLLAKDLARASLSELLGEKATENTLQFEINSHASIWLEQTAGGTFESHDLPDEVQLSTLNAAVVLPNDAGILIGGNFTGFNIEMGWNMSSDGQVIWLNDAGHWVVNPVAGDKLSGLIRQLGIIQIGKEQAILVANNNDQVQCLRRKVVKQFIQ